MTDRAPAAVAAVFLLTYPYLLAINELPMGREGPHAPWTYWLTRPELYVLGTPVALVVAWRSATELRRAATHGLRWWRLPAEGFAIAGGLALCLVFLSPRDALLGALQGGVLVAGLGVIATGVIALARPRSQSVSSSIGVD